MAASRDRRPAATASAQLDSSRFEVARFEVVSTGGSDTLLGLSLRVPLELSARAQPTLIIVRDEVELLHTPRMAAGSRHELAGGGSWLWRGMFPVTPDLARDDDALFSLRLFGALTIGLPAPAQLAGAAPSDGHRPGRRWPYALRRGALLFVVSCQLCFLPAIASPGALAEGTAGSVLSEPTPESAPETPAGPPVGLPGEGSSQPPVEVPSGPPVGTGEGGTEHPASGPSEKAPERTPEAPAGPHEEGAAQPVAPGPPSAHTATPAGEGASSSSGAECPVYGAHDLWRIQDCDQPKNAADHARLADFLPARAPDDMRDQELQSAGDKAESG